MIDKSKLESLAKKVHNEVYPDSIELYHSKLAQELSKLGVEYTANPPKGWSKPEFEDIEKNPNVLEDDSEESTGPVYSFYVDEGLYIEIVSKTDLTEKDFENMKKSVETSRNLLYLPDSISKGAVINFPKGGDKPEIRWYSE